MAVFTKKGGSIMKTTEENKMELLEQYVRDIYMATCHAIPHPEKRPKIKDIKRLPHEALVSNYALILEFIIRIKNESSILLQIINDESFKPYSLEEYSKNFDKLAAKIKDWELREYLKRRKNRREFIRWRRGFRSKKEYEKNLYDLK